MVTDVFISVGSFLIPLGPCGHKTIDGGDEQTVVNENAQEKDEQTSTKNKYNQNTSNNNYNNNISNVISTDTNREKQNIYNNKAQIYEINEDQDINGRQFEEDEEKKEGVDALRARYENEKNPNDESDEFFQSNNNKNNKQQVLFNTSIDEPGDDFSKYIFDGINSIRENPQSFIQKIENAKKNIMYDKKGICVYKSSVKVALSKGIPAFDESIDYLKNLRPMQKLIFSSELLIPPPENEDQIKDRTYMNEIIN